MSDTDREFLDGPIKRSLANADECQKCEEREPTEVTVAMVGDMPVGPLFVCEECAEGADE